QRWLCSALLRAVSRAFAIVVWFVPLRLPCALTLPLLTLDPIPMLPGPSNSRFLALVWSNRNLTSRFLSFPPAECQPPSRASVRKCLELIEVSVSFFRPSPLRFVDVDADTVSSYPRVYASVFSPPMRRFPYVYAFYSRIKRNRKLPAESHRARQVEGHLPTLPTPLRSVKLLSSAILWSSSFRIYFLSSALALTRRLQCSPAYTHPTPTRRYLSLHSPLCLRFQTRLTDASSPLLRPFTLSAFSCALLSNTPGRRVKLRQTLRER
ncbi:hypothetical protein BZA70DRAFT_305408, partial [Myxozyma melibiosi]